MDDASGHGGHKDEPTTEIGRVVREVLNAGPQIVTTLQAKPDDHGHGHGHGHEENFLDARLTKLIEEIQAGLKGDMRNPSGLVADCKDALAGLMNQFEGLKPIPGHGESHGPRPHGHLLAAVLLALAVVAGGFLLFGAHTDVVYAGGSDPDYRQLAYPGAIDAPNLGTWMAWAVLLLALAGGAIWAMGLSQPSGRRPRQDNARLRRLYENGAISGDLYDRGRRLAPDAGAFGGPPPAAPAPPTREHAKEFGQYILALADAYNHRRRLEKVA